MSASPRVPQICLVYRLYGGKRREIGYGETGAARPGQAGRHIIYEGCDGCRKRDARNA
jgi:hypothetical protein